MNKLRYFLYWHITDVGTWCSSNDYWIRPFERWIGFKGKSDRKNFILNTRQASVAKNVGKYWHFYKKDFNTNFVVSFSSVCAVKMIQFSNVIMVAYFENLNSINQFISLSISYSTSPASCNIHYLEVW